MDTAERIGTQPAAEHPKTYDGFISYSHAADDLLAPRLQAGLQRFAKPWWKRRAVRIFRDESSLAANPHLWSSITEALDDSSWFVLLLSEDAASSEWVGKEIEHWTANKPSDRILPVVTDGTFGWEDGDVTGTSVPPALHGVFAEEPRWVDLRFARDEEQLDLQNPDFSAAVADIAATIRGIPKDELASEEVKQHRRTVRTAWTAGIALLVLTVAAVVAGVFAIGQRNDARNAQDLAEQNAQAEAEARQEADTNRRLAEENANQAQANAEEATRNAQLAQARELAASALNVQERNPELALLLTLEGIDRSGGDLPIELINALRGALQENKLRARHAFDPAVGVVHASLSSDGTRLLATSQVLGITKLIDLENGETLWRYSEPESTDSFNSAFFGPDDSFVAIDVHNHAATHGAPDAVPGRVVLVEAATGEHLRTIELEGCDFAQFAAAPGPISPDGRWMAISNAEPGCAPVGESTQAGWIDLYDTATWEPMRRLPTARHGRSWIGFTNAGDVALLTGWRVPTQVIDLSTGDVFLEMADSADVWPQAALSPDADRLAYADTEAGRVILRVVDVASGVTVGRLQGLEGILFASSAGLTYSPDGDYILGLTDTALLVWDATSFELLSRLPAAGALTAAASPDLSTIVTSNVGEALEWTTMGQAALQSTTLTVPEIPGRVGGDPVDFTGDNGRYGRDLSASVPNGAAAWLPVVSGDGLDQYVGIIDPATGAVEHAVEASAFSTFPDGRLLLDLGGRLDNDGNPTTLQAPAIWDPAAGTITPLFDCTIPAERVTFAGACGASPYFGSSVAVSIDGSLVAAVQGNAAGMRVWDATTLEPVATVLWPLAQFGGSSEQAARIRFDAIFALGDGWVIGGSLEDNRLSVVDFEGNLVEVVGPGRGHTSVAVAPSDDLLVLATQTGEVDLVRTDTWETTATWRAHDEGIRAVTPNPSGTRLATVGADDIIRIWDISTQRELDRIPAAEAADTVWIDDETLGIWRTDGVWEVVTLDVAELIEFARTVPSRELTDDECILYRIEPCPADG